MININVDKLQKKEFYTYSYDEIKKMSGCCFQHVSKENSHYYFLSTDSGVIQFNSKNNTINPNIHPSWYSSTFVKVPVSIDIKIRWEV